MPSRWRRAVATLIGLWFTASVSGVALQLCPEHGGQMMAGMHHAGTNCDPSTGHVPGVPSGSPAQHGNGQHHNSSHDDCTCTGMCCLTAAVRIAAPRLTVVAVVDAEPQPAAPLGTNELAPRPAPDVTLPPPLGPPALRA
jgi:hypothetical protein